MTNSTFRCSGCKGYFPMADAVQVGMQRFCSKDCRLEAANRSNSRSTTVERTTATSRSSSEVPKAVRERVLERDGSCAYCGRRANHVHHICYRSEGVDHSEHNLVLLCQGHHDLVHSNKRRWKPVLLAYIWVRYVEQRYLRVPEVVLYVVRVTEGSARP